jgi:hypothetical protein
MRAPGAALLFALGCLLGGARNAAAEGPCHWDRAAAECTFSDSFAAPVLLGSSGSDSRPIDG